MAGNALLAELEPVGVPADAAALMDDEFIASGGHPLHVHEFHQFLYVPVGEISVTARGVTHRVATSVALWVPAGVWHSARFGSDSLIVVESFEADDFRLPYSEATPINVTDVQRRLLLERMRASDVTHEDPAVFAALCAGHRDCLPLPQPTGRAAEAVARALTRNPGDSRTAAQWADDFYTSSTSLRRAFRAETGLAFSEWRTRLRLNHSLDLLAQGHMVSAVAVRVGFVSTNGYILAFRRYFGQTPGAYVKGAAGAARHGHG